MRNALTIIGGLTLLNSCSDGCSNTVVDQSTSPNGGYSAVLFQRDCGATTGFSTQISLLDDDEIPKGSANVFIADDDHGAADIGEWGGPEAGVQWISDDHMLVRFATKSRIYKQETSVSGVKISYQEITH